MGGSVIGSAGLAGYPPPAWRAVTTRLSCRTLSYIHPDGDAHGDGMSSYALRDIAAGEELTDDYALYDKLPWFEAICQERGVTGSCTEVGRQFD